ncbi:SAM-dependent methyltransferase [Bradyrhizobium sp. LM2.7]
MSGAAAKRGGVVKALARTALQKFRQDGVSGVLKSCIASLRRLHDRREVRSAFDREYGTDTGGVVPLWKLDIRSPNHEQGVRYQASDPTFVRTAIENLPIRAEDFLFIDIGSGKGLTLLVASEYPFRRILGVEFSAELNSIAAENIRKHRTAGPKCKHVFSILADAAGYEFPPENTILFLYNPFSKEVLQRMLENLRTSLAQSDRKIYIVYSNPVFLQPLDEAEFLERLNLPIDAAVYAHTPARSIVSLR